MYRGLERMQDADDDAKLGRWQDAVNPTAPIR